MQKDTGTDYNDDASIRAGNGDDKGWVIRVPDYASEARRASTRLGTRWGGPSWKLRLENRFLKSAQIGPKLFLLLACIKEGIFTLRPGGKYGRVSQEKSVSSYPLPPPQSECCTPLFTHPVLYYTK